ncbi:transposase [Streptococcus mutans LP13]|uniref:transposase n=2 Tax=Streptococcus mutans TaxID=1309 RepID=UPI00308C6BDF|nr:transposase [Streptococcus mutans LP13]
MVKKGSKFTKYSSEFKLQVVKDYLSGRSGGMPSIVKKYGLKSDNQGLTWTRKYRKNPALLTQDLRGTKSTGRPKTRNLDEMSLEEQNAYLHMENTILKTLRTSPQKVRRGHLYQVVDRLKNRYPVSSLCSYFGFPRSSYLPLVKQWET